MLNLKFFILCSCFFTFLIFSLSACSSKINSPVMIDQGEVQVI